MIEADAGQGSAARRRRRADSARLAAPGRDRARRGGRPAAGRGGGHARLEGAVHRLSRRPGAGRPQQAARPPEGRPRRVRPALARLDPQRRQARPQADGAAREPAPRRDRRRGRGARPDPDRPDRHRLRVRPGHQTASLRKGPGHYSGVTKLPGQGGTVGIAGHRTTYEAPFREVDSLKAGDRITLRMPYGLFTYEVTGHRIVPADYSEAFSTAGSGERLVLSACHPLYSSSERILVDAKLVSAQPLGSAIETTVPALPGPSPCRGRAAADGGASQAAGHSVPRAGDVRPGRARAAAAARHAGDRHVRRQHQRRGARLPARPRSAAGRSGR